MSMLITLIRMSTELLYRENVNMFYTEDNNFQKVFKTIENDPEWHEYLSNKKVQLVDHINQKFQGLATCLFMKHSDYQKYLETNIIEYFYSVMTFEGDDTFYIPYLWNNIDKDLRIFFQMIFNRDSIAGLDYLIFPTLITYSTGRLVLLYDGGPTKKTLIFIITLSGMIEIYIKKFDNISLSVHHSTFI